MLSTHSLHAGEIITAHQDFPLCGPASNTIQVTVAPAAPVSAPDIFSPICAGATRVKIKGLRVGAIVHIFVDGIDQGSAEASETAEVFQLPTGLAAGSSGTAAQTVCGNVSHSSDAVLVASAPSSVQTPFIPGPVHACAPAVMVN